MVRKRMNRKSFAAALILGLVGANFLLIISSLTEHINGPLGGVLNSSVGVVIILVAIYLLITWTLAIIKRLHDIDVTGWLAVIFLVTPAIIVLAFIPGSKGPNTFGKQPDPRLNLRSVFLWRG